MLLFQKQNQIWRGFKNFHRMSIFTESVRYQKSVWDILFFFVWKSDVCTWSHCKGFSHKKKKINLTIFLSHIHPIIFNTLNYCSCATISKFIVICITNFNWYDEAINLSANFNTFFFEKKIIHIYFWNCLGGSLINRPQTIA